MKKPEANAKKEIEVLKIDTMGVTRAKVFDNGNVVFDLNLNGITIYGMRVVEGENGDFVAFPSRKGTDGKYYNIAYARISNDDQGKILALVEAELNK